MTMCRIALLLLLITLAGCDKGSKSFEQRKQEGMSAYVAGDYRKAREILKEAQRERGTDRDVLYYLGRAYSKDYIYDSAILVLKQADYLHPDDVEINQAILHAAQTSRAWVEAKDALMKLVRLGKAPDDYLERFNRYYGEIGNIPQLWFYRNELLKADPNDPLRYLELANVQLRLDSLERAIEILEDASSRFEDVPELTANLALYYSYANNDRKAEQLFRSLVEQYPDNPIHLLNLANVLTTQDSHDKKREGLQIYERIRPQVPAGIPIDSLIDAVRMELERQ
mgnify:CR=1 FL=1